MKITLQDLKIAFAEQTVLNGISFSIAKNKFTGLIGPNGCGKSTLLKCIYRVLQPDEGIICLDEKNICDYTLKETAQKQAVLTQHNFYNFDFEVMDVVLMGRSPYKKAMEGDNAEDHALAMASLKTVGMENFRHSNFSSLSGGEQQRVMLARALTQNTQCLILDEPTNHLDIKYQLQLLNIIKERQLTVIAAIHDLNIAAMYCDEIIAMKDGLVFTIGSPQAVLTSDIIYEIFEVRSEVLQRKDGRLTIVYKN